MISLALFPDSSEMTYFFKVLLSHVVDQFSAFIEPFLESLYLIPYLFHDLLSNSLFLHLPSFYGKNMFKHRACHLGNMSCNLLSDPA